MHPPSYAQATDDKVLVTSRTFAVIGIGRIDMSEGERTIEIERDRGNVEEREAYLLYTRRACTDSGAAERREVAREGSRKETVEVKIERGRGDACVFCKWRLVERRARHDSLFFFLVVAGTRVPARPTRGASVLDRRLCREIRPCGKLMRVHGRYRLTFHSFPLYTSRWYRYPGRGTAYVVSRFAVSEERRC